MTRARKKVLAETVVAKITISAINTETEGLVIHRTYNPPKFKKSWTVTHARSGLSLAVFWKKSKALKFATEAGKLMDFQRSETEVTRSLRENEHALRHELALIRNEYGGAEKHDDLPPKETTTEE